MTKMKQTWLAVLLLAFALPALALDLDEARAKGVIGERVDGYVAAVKEKPSDEVKALVAEINAKRRAAYEEIAKRTSAPVEAVAALAGQKMLTEKAQPGWYVDDGSGWKKK
jgi:uncharacterized protein YdbL (DUF1318 family)